MYGKHFESMYDGSMYGAGLEVFAVWGYVIAHTKASRIELNPKKLADTLGGDIQTIEKTVEFLCSPDAQSRHKEYDGRRLIKEGEFQYFVPSWATYQEIRNAEERRIYNRVKQQESRAKKAGANTETPEPTKPKTTISIPANLSSESFAEAWNKWLEHLKQKRKPATAHAQDLQLKKLSKMGEKKAVETLYHCIEKGWQGIYEHGENSNGNHEPSALKLSDAELLRQAQM